MTCEICGGDDEVSEREGRVLCAACGERVDWSRIIEIVQHGSRMDPTVSFEERTGAEVGADPFA